MRRELEEAFPHNCHNPEKSEVRGQTDKQVPGSMWVQLEGFKYLDW